MTRKIAFPSEKDIKEYINPCQEYLIFVTEVINVYIAKTIIF